MIMFEFYLIWMWFVRSQFENCKFKQMSRPVAKGSMSKQIKFSQTAKN
jgi:hypothetical protein